MKDGLKAILEFDQLNRSWVGKYQWLSKSFVRSVGILLDEDFDNSSANGGIALAYHLENNETEAEEHGFEKNKPICHKEIGLAENQTF